MNLVLEGKQFLFKTDTVDLKEVKEQTMARTSNFIRNE